MRSETREKQVSRSNIEAWVEAGLRQFKEIKDNEDLVALQIGPLNKDLVNVVYKVKARVEPEMEVFILK